MHLAHFMWAVSSTSHKQTDDVSIKLWFSAKGLSHVGLATAPCWYLIQGYMYFRTARVYLTLSLTLGPNDKESKQAWWKQSAHTTHRMLCRALWSQQGKLWPFGSWSEWRDFQWTWKWAPESCRTPPRPGSSGDPSRKSEPPVLSVGHRQLFVERGRDA